MRITAIGLAVCAVLGIGHTEADEGAPYIIRNEAGDYRWVLGDNYYHLSDAYVTPHIPWASNLAGEPIRALFISPRACHRETIELAQRLSLDFEYIMMPGQPNELTCDNPSKFLHLDPEEVLGDYRAKLTLEYDVIVLANCQWDIFSGEFEQILLRKVEGGTGILLTHQWPTENPAMAELLGRSRDTQAEEYVAACVPHRRIPGLSGAIGQDGPLVHCATVGAGRLAKLAYPNHGVSHDSTRGLTPASPEDAVLPAVLYDYYHALVAKALIWAAGRDAEQRIEGLVLPDELIDAAGLDSLTVELNIAGHSDTDVVLATVARDWWGVERAAVEKSLTLAPGDSSHRLALPRLPGGTHFVDVWLRTLDGRDLDWASAIVDVAPAASVARIELDQPSYPSGATVTGHVTVEGNPPAGSRLCIELRDGFERRLAKLECDVADTAAPFAFDFPQPVAIQHEIVASIMDGHGLVHQKRRTFAVSGLVYDDFAFVLWGADGRNSYRERMIAHASYELGVDSSYGYGKTKDWPDNPVAYWTTRAGLSQFFYGTYLGGLPDGNHVRSLCLSDPDVRRTHREKIRELARVNRHLGGIGYSTGDEYRLSDQGEDLCWSDHCLARLREHLKTKYSSIDELNAAWKTDFTDWSMVVPDTIDEAHAKGNYTAWAENRQFSEYVFAEFHQMLRESVETVQGGAPVGEEGAFDADTYFGVDYAIMRGAATLIHGYERPQQHEHMRSLASKTAMTGYWVGYYNRDYAEERMRWHPWHSLLTGFDSAWWWTAAMTSKYTWPLGFASDLRPQDAFRWMAEETREIKRGIGKLILNADRQHDGIAILYSMPSIRAADAHHEIGVPIGAEHYEGSIKCSELAWILLLEDLGMQYEFVAHSDVAQGLLLRGEYSVLVLPTSVALSEGEANAICAFVRNGGMVIADMWPGVMDEWANILGSGRLDRMFGAKMTDEKGQLVVSQPVDVRWSDSGGERRVAGRLANPALSLDGAKALAMTDDTPVLTEHVFGQGRAHLLNFSINDYFSDWHRAEDHRDIRWRPEGAALRDYVARRLATAGVTAPVRVRKANGEPLIGCEAVFFRRGDARYLGLQYVADNVYFQMGDENWIFDHYELHPDCTGLPVTVSLPTDSHIYDMRAGRYLGAVQDFDTTIAPGQTLMYALLPYEVEGLSLDAEAEAFTARRGSTGIEEIVPARFHVALDTGMKPAALHCVRVDVFDPKGAEMREYGLNALARGGGTTFTIPFALSDAPGQWRVVATDVASGVQAGRRVWMTP